VRCAIYARYSTDNQKDTSIEDQVRVCRERLRQMGCSVSVELVYEDRAATGATMHLRPGIQNLVRDAAEGRFDLVIAESLSRYARDQEDMAYIFKRLTFNEVKMMTVTRAEITELDIGFESTISARYLKDCADQVRRGMRGQAERGKNPGGLSYGYNVVRAFDASGEPIRGLLEINREQAEVIQRVFTEYAAGRSPRAIVKQLNAEGIPSPSGGAWRMSTVNGDGKRGNGILRNQKYIGFLLWNRTHAIRNPDTGKRVFRINPPDEWIVIEKPEWRIISDELWDKAQARRKKYSRSTNPERSRRATRLLSGLLRCGCCGGSVTIQHSGQNGRGERYAARYGCSKSKDTATCENKYTISQPELEERVLYAIREQLMSPEAWEAFIQGYEDRMKAAQRERRSRLKVAVKELKEVNTKINDILNAIENGMFHKSMVGRMTELESRKDELEADIANPENEQKVVLHPGLRELFAKKIADLQETMTSGEELPRLEARQKFRDLISKITLKPINKGANWEITVHGAVAEIIAFTGEKEPGTAPFSSVSPTMVAEVRTDRQRDMPELTATVLLRPLDMAA